VLFEISPQSELARIVIPQEAGMQIEFEFKDWEWNPALAKTLFQFGPAAWNRDRKWLANRGPWYASVRM